MKTLMLLIAGTLLTLSALANPPPPNILMISVDDLNHWVGHLGRNNQVRTPNIDKLAERGMSFHRAYAPSAICNATRTAMMSGMRPSTTGVYENGRDWRSIIGPNRSLPAFFKQQGYTVLGGGKIFHNDKVIRPQEWDNYFTRSQIKHPYQLEGQDLADAQLANQSRTKRYTVGEMSIAEVNEGDDAVWDYHVARWAAEQVGLEHDKPFFIAAGIFRPHLPWHVPKKYFDMYPLESIELPPYLEDDLDDLPYPPSNASEHDMVLEQDGWKQAIRGYLAAITYADVQVGRILDALFNGPNKDNTIVVLWGDHGWHLGEKHRWRKFALWEESTRTPYIWYVPGVTQANSSTQTAVDLQSLWPTLSELTGKAAPDFVEGHSIVDLMKTPDKEWRIPAITTQGYNNHAVRYGPYRYIRYDKGGEEFYDHSSDPYEWHNLAGSAEQRPQMDEFRAWLPQVNRQNEEGQSLFGGEQRYSGLKPTGLTKGEDSGKTD
ncbi:iduronate-2-sulfatase [Alteromonas aestuariivivens]|uniref:Iduronate-2-sulfatase n=1 Tax=Alteromonas aestuariivivens TaxID=1938339 RepID=A0A3D8MFJ6_9ALTE|nr:sulfatase [Alteromonas aestuariivivens]RDV29351.1 iduronate-2-sulfatase [Alteromonas aestuariivivens]